MAVKRVEFYKVGKCQSPVSGLGNQAVQMIEKVSIAFALRQRADALQRKNIANLADGMGCPPSARHPIQERGRRRRDGIVVAVRGAFERPRRSGERPRDHPTDLHRMQMWRQILTQFQQPL